MKTPKTIPAGTLHLFQIVICKKIVTPSEDWLRNQTFKINDLTKFEAINESYRKKDGTFRRFTLQGYIYFKDGTQYKIGTMDATELKKMLRPYASQVDKSPVIEYKNRSERKAVNWTYTFQH